MSMFRRLLSIAFFLCLTSLFVACDSGNTTTLSDSKTASTPPPAATPVRTAQTVNARIHTKKVAIDGKDVTILTDVQDRTLYYFTKDTPQSSACTSGCSSDWPPLLAVDSASLMSNAPLTGSLSVVKTANGNQIAYNGHLLYTYAGDTAPGQTKGQGIGGNWFAATTDLK